MMKTCACHSIQFLREARSGLAVLLLSIALFPVPGYAEWAGWLRYSQPKSGDLDIRFDDERVDTGRIENAHSFYSSLIYSSLGEREDIFEKFFYALSHQYNLFNVDDDVFTLNTTTATVSFGAPILFPFANLFFPFANFSIEHRHYSKTMDATDEFRCWLGVQHIFYFPVLGEPWEPHLSIVSNVKYSLGYYRGKFETMYHCHFALGFGSSNFFCSIGYQFSGETLASSYEQKRMSSVVFSFCFRPPFEIYTH